jgi:hypothetical protein
LPFQSLSSDPENFRELDAWSGYGRPPTRLPLILK